MRTLSPGKQLATFVAIAIILGMAFGSAGVDYDGSVSVAPGPSDEVYGAVYYSDGSPVTDIPLLVTVTNTNAAQTATTQVDTIPNNGIADGTYSVPLSKTAGDIITANVSYGPQAVTNWTSAGASSVQIDLHMTLTPPVITSFEPVDATSTGPGTWDVDFVGQTDPYSPVQLLLFGSPTASTYADVAGDFTFDDVAMTDMSYPVDARCSDGINNGTRTTTQYVHPISPAGGTLVDPGHVTITVPPGALATDTAMYTQNILPGRPWHVDSLELGPSMSFLAPVTVVWEYNDGDLGTFAEEGLGISYFDGASWVWLGGTVDTVGNTVTVNTDHFTPFSLGPATATGQHMGVNSTVPGKLKVPILNLTISNNNLTGDTLDEINIASNNTDDADVNAVKLWLDDGDEIFNLADTEMASQPFTAGWANFTTLAQAIPSLTDINVFVSYDVAVGATAGNYLDMIVPAGNITLANAGVTTGAIDPVGVCQIVNDSLIMPHLIYGFVWDEAGNPLVGETVNVTNTNTGQYLLDVTDPQGRYDVNLFDMPGYYSLGDIIDVDVGNTTSGNLGWNWTTVADNFGEWCNVTIEEGPVVISTWPLNQSAVAETDHNIMMNITDDRSGVDPTTIQLEVEGVNYTVDGTILNWTAPTLLFNTTNAGLSWADGQYINVTLYFADDIVGNTCQNAPYIWWFEANGTISQPTAAPDIRVHKEGNDINITWNPIDNGTYYNIYRSMNVNGTGFNWLAPYDTADDTYYVDVGALSDGNNYSYVVRAANIKGEGSKSNIGWKLRKVLVENTATSDINWIGLPYNTDLQFAQDLINDLGGSSNVNYVARWLPASQSYQNKPPVGGFNWPITPGEGILVNMKTTTVYTMVGSYNNTTMVNIIENAATSDINWIALPYHSSLLFAQDVINDLGGAPNINYIARWLPTSQSYQNKPPVGGFNWATTPGDAILVNAKVTMNNYNLGPVTDP